MAYFIGVDLHKTQFTVRVRTADFCEEQGGKRQVMSKKRMVTILTTKH